MAQVDFRNVRKSYGTLEVIHGVSVTVDDGEFQASDAVDIVVEAPNEPPVADAGADQIVTQGDDVQLNGTASFDLALATPILARFHGLPIADDRYRDPGLSPEGLRNKTLALLVELLLRLGRQQPAILLVEDLHWMDPSTLELLGLLGEAGVSAPLLLLLTARPELRAPWPLLSHHTHLTLNRLGRDLDDSPVSPAQAAELLSLVADGTISGTIAKQVFEKMLETGDAAAAIVDREGLKQTSDTGAIDEAIARILADNADKVEQYKAGKEALFGFFVGQTMKAMQGKANPQVVNELLKKALV